YYEINQITISFLPTQVAEKFVELENNSLRYLLAGGDKLKTYHKGSYQLVDNYGPAENTVVTTTFIANKNYDNIPIGKPISNNQVYILDQNNHLQPIGIPGELCVAGKSLARGYLNREELTNEKFVQNPFTDASLSERMYHTGDLARWLPDGNIEFLGRIDHQVQVRGYRIELGEIEKQLLENEKVNEVAVVGFKDQDDAIYLTAYIVSDMELNVSELKDFLAKRLPDYMIPAYIVQLEQLPLTSNGKVDKKALPEPDNILHMDKEYVEPRNEIETKLAQIWSDVLGKEKIGINDNFFELGGHSLKATDVVSKVYKEFGADISLREIFINPTIKELAKCISKVEKEIYSSIHVLKERDYYPVSSAQRRLYILDQLENANTSYNIPGAMIIEGELKLERLEDAVHSLINRHEALRTSFELIEGEPVQRVHQDVDFNIQHIKSSISNVETVVKEFIKPFDLSQAPLLRIILVELEEKYLLLFDLHHIIADGTTMGILIDELIQLYDQKELPELKIQYKDFAAWQSDLFNSDQINKQEQYWLEQFASEIPILELPLDYPRPTMKSFAGDVVKFEVDKELVDKLNLLLANYGGTLYMLLLASFNILLAKYSGQEDIIVGSPIAGRPHVDLSRVAGMFV
ncbi:MAG: AMP-binding protein, partial [Halanaerobiales bacterium]|nr:AMP-binding protein [Halanaerobiales bacterium]